MEVAVVLPRWRRPLLLLLLEEWLLLLRERCRGDRRLVRRCHLLRSRAALRYIGLLIRCCSLRLIRVICGLRGRRWWRLRNRRRRLEVLRLMLMLLLLLPITILLVPIPIIRIQSRLVGRRSCGGSLSRLRRCGPLLSAVRLSSSCVLSCRGSGPVSGIVRLRRLRRGRTRRKRRLLWGIRSSGNKGVFVHRRLWRAGRQKSGMSSY